MIAEAHFPLRQAESLANIDDRNHPSLNVDNSENYCGRLWHRRDFRDPDNAFDRGKVQGVLLFVQIEYNY